MVVIMDPVKVYDLLQRSNSLSSLGRRFRLRLLQARPWLLRLWRCRPLRHRFALSLSFRLNRKRRVLVFLLPLLIGALAVRTLFLLALLLLLLLLLWPHFHLRCLGSIHTECILPHLLLFRGLHRYDVFLVALRVGLSKIYTQTVLVTLPR